MKKSLLLAFSVALAPMVQAEDKPADAVKAAAKKLGETSYTWSTSSTGGGGGGGGGRGGMSTEGKTEKDGPICLKNTFGDRTTETVIKGGKVAMKTDDGWKSAEELAAGGGGDGGGGGGRRGGGGFARMYENYKAPAAEAATLTEGVKELKKDGDTITGDLTEEAVKTRLTFGGRGGRPGGGGGGGGAAPNITDAKGTVKFWVKEGVLTKYEVNVQGKREGRDGNTQDINRTTTTEIKDVGTTKIEIPAEATAKLKGEKKEEPKKEEKKTD
jgi:hypothetical protein